MIIGTSFRPKDYLESKFWLWEIAQHGSISKDMVLKTPEKQGINIAGAYKLINGLTVSANGDIFAVGKFDGGYQSLIKMNKEGEILFSKNITEDTLGGVNSLILKIVSLTDNNLLLIGRDGSALSNGLVVKVDAVGNRLWEKTYDFGGGIEMFTDGLAMGEKGEFLVIGVSLKHIGTNNTEIPDIHVMRCDVEGNIITEEVFKGNFIPGRGPQLCKLDSDKFVTFYCSKVTGKTVPYSIKAFSSDLKTLWEKQVFELEFPPGPFKINAISRGGFVIAGCKKASQLAVYEYDKGGNEMGNITIEEGIRCDDLSLVCTENKAFIISQTSWKDNFHDRDVKIIALELLKSNK
jgi:hypothetical protein